MTERGLVTHMGFVPASAWACSNLFQPAMLFGIGHGAVCCGAGQRQQDIHCNKY